MLLCVDGSFYTGYTKSVDARVRLHATGKGARYTRLHKPERIVYTEGFDSRSLAMKREKAIKKLRHDQKLRLANLQTPPQYPEARDSSRQ